METIKFAMTFKRKNLGAVWNQRGELWRISRSVTDIHKDSTGDGEKWIYRGDNELYKAHASLSPDELELYIYIEIDAPLRSWYTHAAVIMILDTKIYGSYISKKTTCNTICEELEILDSH